MSETRPNVFQRLAHTWDAVHPYNAAQACLLGGSFHAEQLAMAWPMPAISVRVLTSSEELRRHFTVELNRSFDHHNFRPFVQSTGNGMWLGIIYRHEVADSYSIRQIMQRWIASLTGEAASPPRVRPGIACDGFSVASLLHLIRRYGEYRRVRKVHTMGPLDYPVAVRVFDSLRGVVPPALAYARAHGVKLNDVFVAALVEACDRFIPTQARHGRRGLAVSSIVDLRPYLRDKKHRVGVGCHLGFTGVVCGEHDARDWLRLLRTVARQNQLERTGRFGPPGIAWMHAAELVTRFAARDRLHDFYRKEAPFAGGVSNVNLNDTWFAAQHAAGRVLDYVRISPTGPMVPVVLNVTTLGDDVRLSMTYRSNLMNDWTAGELADAFMRRIEALARSPDEQMREPRA